MKAFQKEIKGILIDRKACSIKDPRPGDKVIPIMDIYKCKLDKNGLIEKLKVRCIFRGDLYDLPLQKYQKNQSFKPGIILEVGIK